MIAGLSLLFAAAMASSNDGGYVHAESGPAFVTFLPVDDYGVTEHLPSDAVQSSVAAGWGWAPRYVRFDLGLRLQHLHLVAQGGYNVDLVDDAYLANYDYVAGLVEASLQTHGTLVVDGFLTTTFGVGGIFSDRKGQPLHSHALPIYGTFELGMLFHLLPHIDARVAVSWVPPVGMVNVISPQFGLLARL